MRSGSLALSTSKSAVLYKFLPAPPSRDLEPLVFMTFPSFAWQAGLKVSRIVPNSFAGTANSIASSILKYDGAGDPPWEATRVRCPGWRRSLHIVRPDTVIAWHRCRAFAWYWTRES